MSQVKKSKLENLKFISQILFKYCIRRPNICCLSDHGTWIIRAPNNAVKAQYSRCSCARFFPVTQATFDQLFLITFGRSRTFSGKGFDLHCLGNRPFFHLSFIPIKICYIFDYPWWLRSQKCWLKDCILY